MKITGPKKSVLQQAARAAGVRLYDLREDGDGHRFTLRTVTRGQKIPWRRLSSRSTYSNGKPRVIPGRVCWHGHREFFRAVFQRYPKARIETSMATYDGWVDFEENHWDTHGSGRYTGGFAPTSYNPDRQPCTCGESPVPTGAR